MSAHIPVMVKEVVAALSPRDGEVYVDGTFGAGGYTRAFLQSADCTVIAIDQDEQAIARAARLQEEFGNRFIIVRGRFGDALELVRAAGFEQVDGFVLDVGVSSHQIDDPQRGFSFRFDGPLDMRMDRSVPQSAADLVNTMPEEELAATIYRYGEERKSWRIARAIVSARASGRIETTQGLAEIIRAVIPRSPKDKSDPATRTFQALRIAVNDELGELRRALNASEKLLKTGGRLIVVSFHSLEDGIVKSFLYEKSGRVPSASRHMPELGRKREANTFALINKKPMEPSEEEVRANPRSRSARLRAALRVEG